MKHSRTPLLPTNYYGCVVKALPKGNWKSRRNRAFEAVPGDRPMTAGGPRPTPGFVSPVWLTTTDDPVRLVYDGVCRNIRVFLQLLLSERPLVSQTRASHVLLVSPVQRDAACSASESHGCSVAESWQVQSAWVHAVVKEPFCCRASL